MTTEGLPPACECDKQACRVFFVWLVCFAVTCVFVWSTQVTGDVSVPPSPICHSVEMDVYLSKSQLSCPSRLSFPDTHSPSSVRKLIATKRQNVSSSPLLFSSVVLTACLVTGQQGDQHQYPGFLGHVRSRPPGRKIMSRRGHDYMAFLRQPVQCDCRNLRKSQQYILRCQHLHFFTHLWPSTPTEEKKGPGAALPGLSVLNGHASGTRLHTSISKI